MKKRMAIVFAVLLAVAVPWTANAQTTCTYVTQAIYSRIITGGAHGAMVYTAYEDSGAYVIGTLSSEGEQTRQSYSVEAWDALFVADEWQTTVHGDASALCPYAHTHVASTVCPYYNVVSVTMTNTVSGVTLENYYIPSTATRVLPSGSLHTCWGRYGYVSPVTLKWDGESRYMALKNDEGRWGVFDTQTASMVTQSVYDDMSAVYGDYAKVYNGTAWGRLDVSGTYTTAFVYAAEDSFSVTEELRQIGDGVWRVFNADNEPISAVFEGSWSDISYAADAKIILAVHADGTSALYDLNGETVMQGTAAQEIRYLQDTCYAVANYEEHDQLVGTALMRVDGAVQPEDTVVQGDVNFDGSINSTDARLVLRYILADNLLTPRQQLAADVDAGAVIDTADARAILMSYLF